MAEECDTSPPSVANSMGVVPPGTLCRKGQVRLVLMIRGSAKAAGGVEGRLEVRRGRPAIWLPVEQTEAATTLFEPVTRAWRQAHAVGDRAEVQRLARHLGAALRSNGLAGDQLDECIFCQTSVYRHIEEPGVCEACARRWGSL